MDQGRVPMTSLLSAAVEETGNGNEAFHLLCLLLLLLASAQHGAGLKGAPQRDNPAGGG